MKLMNAAAALSLSLAPAFEGDKKVAQPVQVGTESVRYRHKAEARAGGEGAPEPAYSLAPFRLKFAATDKIGRRRSGLICAPAGGLQWSEVDPGRERLVEAARGALRQEGVDVFVPNDLDREDGVIRGRQRIYGTVLALRLDACSPQWGWTRVLGRGRTWKGSGALRVKWRVYDAVSRAQVAVLETCNTFESDGTAGALARLPEFAIEVATRSFAERLSTADADSASGESCSVDREPTIQGS